MSYIFISYNQEDSDFAAVLMMHVEKAGFDTWMDKSQRPLATEPNAQVPRSR
jgi:hypothetical protein